MANMYPRPLPDFLRNNPKRNAERKIYDALEESLDPSWDVFYRVSWIRKEPNTRPKDGEIDFVLCHPDHGILVLEVKGGGIRRDGESGVWWSTDRNEQPHKISDPVEQTLSAMYSLLAKVREQKGWATRPLDIGRAIAFPDCYFRSGIPLPDLRSDFIIDASNMESLARKITTICAFWGNQKPHMHLGQDGMALMRKMLAYSIEMPSPLSYRSHGDERAILKLTEEQFNILYTLSQVRRAGFSGGAGTGKTVLALEKARRMAAEEFDVLLTCISKELAKYLFESTGPNPRLTIQTFEEICRTHAVEAGIFRGRKDESEKDYAEKTLPEMLMKALDTLPAKYDAIIVDEGQDFHDEWWDPLQLCLKDPRQGVFYIFYDDNQNVYKRKPAFPADILNLTLSTNFRNTKAIHRFSNRFYKGKEVVPRGPDGNPVQVTTLQQEADQFGTIKRILREKIDGGYSPEDIAVLSPLSKKNSLVYQHFRSNPPAKPSDFERKLRSVLFESIPHFKGLERKVVLMCEIESIKEEDRDFMLYTGLSRARTDLIVVGTAKAIKRLGLDPPKHSF